MRIQIYESFQTIASDQVCVYFQDAHEFFCSLIDHIQEEVSSLLKKQSVNRADCPELGSMCPTTYSSGLFPSLGFLICLKYAFEVKFHPTITRHPCSDVGSMCSCTVRNSLTCVDCGKVSHVEEMYRDFSIALPEDER